MNKAKEQSLSFKANEGDIFTAGTDNPIRVETNAARQELSPYVTVSDNLKAKISHSVFCDMVNLGIEQDGTYGIWSDDVFFYLYNLEGTD
jgi:hypothetical protein